MTMWNTILIAVIITMIIGYYSGKKDKKKQESTPPISSDNNSSSYREKNLKTKEALKKDKETTSKPKKPIESVKETIEPQHSTTIPSKEKLILDYTDYEDTKQQLKDLQAKLVSNLKNQIQASLPALQEIDKVHPEILFDLTNSNTSSYHGITLFKDDFFTNYAGGISDGIVSMDLESGDIQIYYADEERVKNALELASYSGEQPDYLKTGTTLSDAALRNVICNGNNYQLAMFATNPKALLSSALSSKQEVVAKAKKLLADN